MSIQVNLLPDVRLDKLRAQQKRRLFSGVAVLVSGVAVAVVVILFVAIQAQNLQISQAQDKIRQAKDDIKNTPNVDKILATQGRLTALPQIYARIPHVSSFFAVLASVSPTDVSVSQLSVDQTMTIRVIGAAKSYASAAKLAKAMEAQKLSNGSLAFTNVQLGSLSSDTTNKVSFNITATMSSGVYNGNHS